jgi:hypothetical protein
VTFHSTGIILLPISKISVRSAFLSSVILVKAVVPILFHDRFLAVAHRHGYLGQGILRGEVSLYH